MEKSRDAIVAELEIGVRKEYGTIAIKLVLVLYNEAKRLNKNENNINT